MFYKQLHGLRGLASLMVFFAHITAGYNLHIYGLWGDFSSPGSIQYYISNVGTFGVEVFFFLSGFVIYKSSTRESQKDFFKRRFFRIYPVFILFSSLFIVGNYYLNIKPELNDFLTIALGLSFMNLFFDSPALTPNSWSITYEVWYYFTTFYLVSFFVKKEKLEVKKVCAFLIFVWLLIKFPITLYFVLGAIFSSRIEKIEMVISRLNYLAINVIFFVSISILTFLVGKGFEFGQDGGLNSFFSLQILIPILLSIVIATLFSKKVVAFKFLTSKLMLFFGNVSYTLYLLHPFTYKLSKKIILEFNINNHYISFSLFIFLTVFFTVCLSMVINKYYEMPIYKAFSNKEIYSAK